MKSASMPKSAFLHTHPFDPFIPKHATKLIVGTLPPPRFTQGIYKQGDVNFSYGSIDGQLWPILDRIYNLNLIYETTSAAIEQRKQFLIQNRIGICDIVAEAKRDKIDASDIGMYDVKLRPLFQILKHNPQVKTLLFMGGKSKNGPEYFFRKLAQSNQITLTSLSDDVPRVNSFNLTPSRLIKTITLTAPSGAANRAVGSMQAYKAIKAKNPDFNTLDFRVMQYKAAFNTD